jgi:hypothetical protein
MIYVLCGSWKQFEKYCISRDLNPHRGKDVRCVSSVTMIQGFHAVPGDKLVKLESFLDVKDYTDILDYMKAHGFPDPKVEHV